MRKQNETIIATPKMTLNETEQIIFKTMKKCRILNKAGCVVFGGQKTVVALTWHDCLSITAFRNAGNEREKELFR